MHATIARRKLSRFLSGGVALFALGACAVGPDFRTPDAPSVSTYTRDPLPAMAASVDSPGGDAQRFLPGSDISSEWWTLFHSAPLDALIAQAVKNNPSLQSAQAGLRVAMENVSAQQGFYYPSVGASIAANREQNAKTLSPTLNSSVLLFSLYQTQLQASWTPDIFGANRRQVEALRSLAGAQRFQLEATYLALTANVAAAAVQEASLRAQLAANRSIVQGETEALAILKRQYDLGQIAGAAVAAQEAALAEVRQTLPPLEKALAQQRDLLTALAGRLPSDEIGQTFELDALTLPKDLPLSLPSAIVRQRPDIRAAEELLHAASAQIGIATANLYPAITLTAEGGSVATALGGLFASGNTFWAVGAGLTQPIFQGGTLLHRKRAAEAAYDQALGDYRSTVIAAFENVADALHALQSDADALNAAVATETAASRSLAIARRRLELGQTGYLEFLDAQSVYQHALISRVQAQASRYADTAALFQALGGGWWNRPPEDAAAQSASR